MPPVINYAGQVAVDGEAFEGNGLFKFAIVNDSGSTTYWSNDGTSTAGAEPTASVSVSVSGGLYSILLGNSAIQGMNAIDSSIFQQHMDAKLRVWFNDGTNGFQQLTPDRSFASVPYALSAASAGSADIAPGSINGSMLAPSLLSDLNSSISDGSVSTAKMDPNLVRYFIPEISTNPAAVSIIQGAGTTLSVQADGKFLSYQWQKNGANLAGQTNPSLVLSNTNANTDDANYSVVISNDWGSVTSPLARVTVATGLPTITILGSATFLHEAATPYTDAGATAEDALGGDLTSSISITSADINVTDVGDQVVTYSVTDAGGNANTATRTVTVQDTTDPVITLNQGTSYTHNLNTAWIDPGYDAQDTLDGNLTASISITGTVDVNSTGTYTLNYFVSDAAGNQADINRTVNVAPMGPWTFTNAGATGRFGPTQSQIDDNYSGTTLEGLVTINATHQGIQEWSVPASGTYRIVAKGGWGGIGNSVDDTFRGRGASIKGNFSFSKDTILKVVVGQSGVENTAGDSANGGGFGGGGSFVWPSSSNNQSSLLLAAGGGGGSSIINTNNNIEFCKGLGGNDDTFGLSSPSGVVNNGSGGSNATYSNGAKGWISMFSSHDFSGVARGNHNGEGGFGGGGSGVDSAPHGGGGGGGFSGGGGGQYAYNSGSGNGDGRNGGGGGGSFNGGTNQDNQAGVNEGHGKVIITYIGN